MSQRIDEARFIDIHGTEQWVTLRGEDARNPALMSVTGAGAAFSRMAPVFAPWERDFTLVQWDQPGAGATCAKGGIAPAPFTYGRLARDGIAVAEWAKARLGVPLALFCISGGTVTGLTMIGAGPDLFGAYVGQGQVVVWAAHEQTSYDLMLARARAAGDAAMGAAIEEIGRPPWAEVEAELVKSKYANAMTPQEQAAIDPAAMAAVRAPPEGASWVAKDLPPVDQFAASFAAYRAIRAELQAFKAGRRFEVPMVLLQGAEDAHTTTPEVRAWAAEIEAPAVVYEELPEAGHMAVFLTDRLGELLRRIVRPLVSGASPPREA
jgi:pimeloyl-ACP methyl ester carboxylesterase